MRVASKRWLAPALAAALVAALAPAAGARVHAGAGLAAAPAPALETNPIGTLRWLPANADSKPAAGFHRLTVVYDSSRDADGKPTTLLNKGAFGVKFFTTSLVTPEGSPTFHMVGNSPRVRNLQDVGAPGDVSRAFAGVSGDRRDGDCAKAGTDAFSAAYTTTRVVLDPAYQPLPCERVLDTLTDGEGNTTGYRVRNHVPGFWIDLDWPEGMTALDTNPGRLAAEVWYGALYDTDGTGSGEWYTQVDNVAQSSSVYGPGDYYTTFSFTATPGGMAAPECHSWTPQNAPGSFDQFELTIPEIAGAKRLIWKLYNKGDWDFFVEGPQGGEAGNFLVEETIEMPFRPGKYTVRGCNFAGEPQAHGALIVGY